jgi:hypothetical protein
MLPQRHINQAIPHKDIRPTITFNEMLMKTSALFKRNYFGRCISTPPKDLYHRPDPCLFPSFDFGLILWDINYIDLNKIDEAGTLVWGGKEHTRSC